MGVVGELLRGDRLLAHLARLGQHLEVARQPRRDAEREPVAVEAELGAAAAVIAPVFAASSRPPFARSGLMPVTLPISVERRAQRIAVEDELADLRAVDLDHRDPLEVALAAAARRPRCRPRAARSGRPRRGALEQLLAGLVAEVAVGPAVESHRMRESALAAASVIPLDASQRRGTRDTGAGSRNARRRGDHRRVVGAELAARELQLEPAPLAEPRPRARAAASSRPRRRRARRRASRRRRAPARAWPSAGRRPPPGTRRPGRRAAPRASASGRARATA